MTSHFRRYWLPVVLWAALIFSLSSVSKFPRAVEPLLSFDKIPHVIEYAVLSFLLARAFKHSPRRQAAENFRVLAVAAALLYAITDEIHQHFVPYRSADVMDVLFDGIGAVIGQLFVKDQEQGRTLDNLKE